MQTFPRLVLAIGFVVLLPALAMAQVDCGDPNNLCTGDPCVIPTLEVEQFCTVDFGSRSLVIAGALSVPQGATVSLTAGTIAVTGNVLGPGQGDDVRLNSLGAFSLTGQVVLRSIGGGSFLRITSNGNVDLSGIIRVRSRQTDPGGIAPATGRFSLNSPTVLSATRVKP
jgi:hypothetical protein